MTVFNINHQLEGGSADRVASLFKVLSDSLPIKRAFQEHSFLASFVGSKVYAEQPKEVDITSSGEVVRAGAFEAIRTVPRQMVMFNKGALQEELMADFVEGLEFQRFAGGIGDSEQPSIISPFVDGVVKDNTQGNVVLEESSFLSAYSKLHKVGAPYVVFNPSIEGASASVKELLDIFPSAQVSAPAWLQEKTEMSGVKGFVTTAGAMALGSFTDPIFSMEEHPETNEVTIRLTSEIFGAEVFPKATAIVGTPVKPV